MEVCKGSVSYLVPIIISLFSLGVALRQRSIAGNKYLLDMFVLKHKETDTLRSAVAPIKDRTGISFSENREIYVGVLTQQRREHEKFEWSFVHMAEEWKTIEIAAVRLQNLIRDNNLRYWISNFDSFVVIVNRCNALVSKGQDPTIRLIELEKEYDCSHKVFDYIRRAEKFDETNSPEYFRQSESAKSARPLEEIDLDITRLNAEISGLYDEYSKDRDFVSKTGKHLIKDALTLCNQLDRSLAPPSKPYAR